MRRRTITAIVLTLFLTISTSFILNMGNEDRIDVSGATIIVGSGGTIQDAIDNATAGDTIIIGNGTYNEIIVINKTLTILGNSSERVWIIGNGTGSVITVSSPHVNISGISVHTTTKTTGGHGIYCSADNLTVENVFVNNTDIGIYLYYADGCRILDGELDINNIGSYTYTGSNNEFSGLVITNNPGNGIQLANSGSGGRNRIHDCVITGNGGGSTESAGVFLWGSGAKNNMIEDNLIDDNLNGIECRASGITGNIFRKNVISNSTNYAVRYTNSAGPNTFYHNSFLNNTADTFGTISSDDFDIGKPGGGNYWDGYNGTDPDGDGIGETSYSLSGGAVDNYPWVSDNGWKRVRNNNTDTWYPAIQYAVENTTTGDKIWVTEGIYYESINISMSIILSGENGPDGVIIDGQGKDHCLIIENSNSGSVSNIEFNNVTYGAILLNSSNIDIIHCRFNGLGTGLSINNSDDNIVQYNEFQNNSETGIEVVGSERNQITENEILKNEIGVSLPSKGGQLPLNIQQLTNSIDGVYDEADINNNGEIAYMKRVGTYYEIFLWDGYTSHQISDNSFHDILPKINNNGEIVWYGYDNNIYFWNGDSVIQVTPDSMSPGDQFDINDNGEIVWRDGYDGDNEIYHWDGQAISKITENSYDDRNPLISDNGNVTWVGIDGDWDIYSWDGSIISQISTSTNNDQMGDINSKGEIAWYVYDGSDTEIFLWDGATTTQVTNDATDDDYPRLNDNGEVTWMGVDTEWEIYFWDGEDITQITDDDKHKEYPKINNNGELAWYTEMGGGAWEIFFWDGRDTIQVTDTGTTDYRVNINDRSELIWNGYTGTEYQLFFASYKTDRNQIYKNTISENDMGISIEHGNDNLIYHNEFKSNDIQAYDTGENHWDLGYPDGGNYWNDHTNTDYYSGPEQWYPGSDGIADNGYDISGWAASEDHYPLISSYYSEVNGGITFISHDNGEVVKGEILLECASTAPYTLGISFYVNGNLSFIDRSQPYQYILDTTPFSEDDNIVISAIGELRFGNDVSRSISLFVNNVVDKGTFITVETGENTYHPDQMVTAYVNTVISTPDFDTVAVRLNYNSPSGPIYFVSNNTYPESIQWVLTFPLPSDAETGSYTLNVTVMGFMKGELLWTAIDTYGFTVSGSNIYDSFTANNWSMHQLHILLAEVQNDVANINLSAGETLGDIANRLDEIEENILTNMEGMNSTLRSLVNMGLSNIYSRLDSLEPQIQDISTGLADLEGGLGSSITDIHNRLSALEENLSNDMKDIHDYIGLRTDQIELYLDIVNISLHSHMDLIETQMTEFRSSILEELDSMVLSLYTMNETGSKERSEISGAISDSQQLMRDLNEITLEEMDSALLELIEKLKDINDTESERHLSNLNTLKTELDGLNETISGEMGQIEMTLEALSKLDGIISDLEEVDRSVESSNEDLSGNDRTMKNLLIIIIILVIFVIGILAYNLFMERKKPVYPEN